MTRYWISNLNQSWTDLWGIISFIPEITIMASVVIFFWGFKVLMINSKHSSVREYIFKSLVSCYAVACCWGIFFAFCAVFVSPIQIYHQQSGSAKHFFKPATDRSLQSSLVNSYAENVTREPRRLGEESN